MDRNTLSRWLLIAGIVFLGMWAYPKFFGSSSNPKQPIPDEKYVNAPGFAADPVLEKADAADAPVVASESCSIKGNRFDAELSTRGAALTHFYLRDPQYADANKGMDMVTSSWNDGAWGNVERWRPLRTLFRADAADDQLAYDRFNWKLERLGDTGCKFTYADAGVSIEKVVKAGERPFELAVETTIKNTAEAPKKHSFAIEMFGFRTNAEVKSHFGRTSPFITDLSCGHGKDVTRKNKEEFKEGWLKIDGADRWAAVSNYYFATALVPGAQGGTPSCQLLAELYESPTSHNTTDDDASAVYHARLAYAQATLAPGASTTYSQTAYLGPKEREILKSAAGGDKGMGELINLGFFSPVAKVLVGFLVILKEHVTGNWGLAIILMTICVRLILFPLTWKSIKTTVAMRRLKPEMDELNKKFADDMQARNLATMELYKKRGVNPFGGCLPQLVQMPVWFAMYTTLQTAVEMYHEKFLWFKDLSAPDQLVGPFNLPLLGVVPAIGILPFVLGAFMIVQQRIVPQQGMDPMQQKMMMYLLPGVFTVMMLFLPAALGIYMLTNSILGITQQLAVEQFAPRDGGGGKGAIEVKEVKGGSKAASINKGKARV